MFNLEPTENTYLTPPRRWRDLDVIAARTAMETGTVCVLAGAAKCLWCGELMHVATSTPTTWYVCGPKLQHAIPTVDADRKAWQHYAGSIQGLLRIVDPIERRRHLWSDWQTVTLNPDPTTTRLVTAAYPRQ